MRTTKAAEPVAKRPSFDAVTAPGIPPGRLSLSLINSYIMQTLDFSIRINAPREKVWDSLWSEAGYRHWTAAFAEGSYYEGDFTEGGRVRFLGPNGSGMWSIVGAHHAPERVVFVHQGAIKDGAEQEPGEWAGTTESYTLADAGSATELSVQVETMEAAAGYFNETFPKALARLKEAVEGSL
ncbi:MAG: SRPBCC domain-containing protein [Chitinophagaceae bacterium]|nr:MAG: SRPBCC domain-containing protein [Chitinophagaceae bacterium]